ncbi:MAG: homoserine kinase, partial [Metallosphaera sp.]
MECKKARAYSSSANLGSGFDILSMAHTAFFDTVEICVENKNSGDIVIESNSNIPLEPTKNSATYPIVRIMEERGIKASLRVKVIKGIPEGLGLGSSGASAAAAVMAFNNLFKLNLS